MGLVAEVCQDDESYMIPTEFGDPDLHSIIKSTSEKFRDLLF